MSIMPPSSLKILLLMALVLLASSLNAQHIIFEEDFDDGVADGFFPDSDLWVVNSSGQYEIENWGFEILSTSYFGEFYWVDFHLTLDMLTQDSVHNSVGFRIQENGDMYVATLRGEPYKDVYLFKMVNGIQNLLFASAFSNTLTDWHHLEIIANYNDLAFVVNGELAFQYADEIDPFLTGRQALISYTGGVVEHQVLQVDNVRVINTAVATDSIYLDQIKALYR